MRYSTSFAKTSKTAPHDTESVNARFLTQGGFVHQEMAGVYSWLPLGLRVLQKVSTIIREEMNALGAEEVLLPALQPKEGWLTTGRWDSMDDLFKVPSRSGKEYALGPTHEEIVTPLVQQFVKSYKDLPVAVYQLQTKFRDELRAKSGVLRGREFGMKDMYSFHASKEDFEAFYQRAIKAYLQTFSRCGLDAKVVEASGGAFTKKLSHEFQIITPAGEDTILACLSCFFAQNSEIATYKASDRCPQCGGELVMTKGVEAGNIFDLGQRFSEPFNFEVSLEDGSRQKVFMGCYGIGTTRLVGAIVEASHDERGIIWPKSVAPYHIHLISLGSKDRDRQAHIQSAALEIYETLTNQNVEVLWDDRQDSSAGEKFADADLIGLPLRLIISEKTLKEESVEWKARAETEQRLVKVADVLEEVGQFLKPL
ncbi:MAG: aminoacyl--tRNA ligase-related protein [Candidatus Uhrbacteria bacterium]|nr:aminoacyl--tRNA ligase-related protein [Candidatus Uhrbacteria bacterium]